MAEFDCEGCGAETRQAWKPPDLFCASCRFASDIYFTDGVDIFAVVIATMNKRIRVPALDRSVRLRDPKRRTPDG